MANLSLKHIDKIYDNNVQAVFDFNLEIADKEFIVLLVLLVVGRVLHLE